MSDVQKPKEARKKGWIYLLRCHAAPGRIKVGFSAKDPVGYGGRIAYMTFILNAFGLEFEVFSMSHDDAAAIERAMLNVLAPFKAKHGGKSTSREMFDFDFEHAKRMLTSANKVFGTPSSWSLWKEQCLRE